tara:strand:+ start:59 stop:646 length:588 start_codon:yes stop_codon:yes gene_type:complete
MIDFEQNDTQTILDSLLFAASNDWGMESEDILENMNKIAYHESAGTMNPRIKQYGGGPGRGLFQFEMDRPGQYDAQGNEYINQGASTAVQRLINRLGYIPEFAKGLEEKNYDVSDLSPGQQQILFLANLLQKPNIKDEKGNIISKAGFYDTDDKEGYSDEELANFWATHHHAGTTPGTVEYNAMINKFLRDLQDY